MKKLVGVFCLLTTVALVGCGKKNDAAKSGYDGLPQDAKLVVMNDAAYTKAQANQDLAIELSLAVAKYGDRLTKDNREALIRNARSDLFQKWVFRTAMLDEARKRNVELTEDEYADYQKRIVGQFGKFRDKAKRKLRFSDLKIAVGHKNAVAFEKRLREDALIRKVRHVIREGFTKPVTEADLADYRQRVADINAEAAATNAAIWKIARKAHRSIAAGMSYDVVGEKIAEVYEHASFDPQWGTFRMKDLEGESNLVARLPKMKLREVTPAIACDNGIGIVRLNAITTKDDKGNEMDPAYSLSRINFELAESCVAGESDEEAKASIAKFKADIAFKEAMTAIRDGLKVEYPHGEDVMKVYGTPNAVKKKGKAK